MDASRKYVAMLGAYDRFNYGDLLFPIIIKNEIGRSGRNFDCHTFSLKKSDMSKWSAIPTRSLHDLMSAKKSGSRTAVLFAGGGTIGASWTNMFANLLGPRGNALLYYFGRLLERIQFNPDHSLRLRSSFGILRA